MIIFIDESGDTGFKFNKGSSTNFVLALVIFENDLAAEETASKIKKLRKKLNKNDKFEFKFNKCNKKFRLSFLNAVKDCKFQIKAIVLKKDKINKNHFLSSTSNFYNFTLAKAIQKSSKDIHKAKIKLDGYGDKEFRKNLLNYLKSQLSYKETQIIKNLRFCDSSKNVLIQLSDMVAGSIRRHYDKKYQDYQEYRKILRKKEENIWEIK